MRILASFVKEDETFLKILGYVRNGWSDSRRKLDQDVKPYFKMGDEITALNILMKNNQILIPKSLRRVV